VVPVVLVLILVLLGLLLRSLVAPWYLALTRSIGVTGGTVTAAGIILAGTFTVLGLAGVNSQAQQLGFAIAFGVLLDTFFVRTLLIPSIAMPLGRWNWWPAALSRSPARPPATPPGLLADATRSPAEGDTP
jgi:RND superfamily putative drug exporter